MALVRVNGIRLNYDDAGAGEPVVLIMGTGGRGQTWHVHQVPALTGAGYRVITFDNRGIAPSDLCTEGFTVDDLVNDVAALIGHLGIGPARVVGVSMGASVAQELALAKPELVHQAVLMASRGRTDIVRTAMARAEIELLDSGVDLPVRYLGVMRALQSLSPRTLNDDQLAADWLDMLELAGQDGPGVRAQLGIEPMPDRLRAYQDIRVPCHVIAFADDLIAPPGHAKELADAIPGATYELVEGAGHYGYLEDPATVNKSILEFFWRSAL
jgi:pimeloyl-ACP methyl ester carboxylesterase